MGRDPTDQSDPRVAHHNVRKTKYAAHPRAHPYDRSPSDGPVWDICAHPRRMISDRAPTNPPPDRNHFDNPDPWKWSVYATNLAIFAWIFPNLRQYAPKLGLATCDSPNDCDQAADWLVR